MVLSSDRVALSGAIIESSGPFGLGDAGSVTIRGLGGDGTRANSISLSQSAIQTLAGAPVAIKVAAAGAISLAADQIVLNSSTISTTVFGAGNAGNIQINAGNQLSMTNSFVTTEANAGSGGAIKITTNPTGTVQLTNSTISASVHKGTGGGGSVTIDPQYVLLQKSQILANAFSGPGGSIFITTNLLLPDSTSLIRASSQFGPQGTITIQSPIAPASRIITLSQKPLVPTSLLSQYCAKLAQGIFSSFSVAGRDSLPAEPDGWLSSPLALATAITEPVGSMTSEPETHMTQSEATEETPILSLRRIAPPGFLTQSFAVDESGCTS